MIQDWKLDRDTPVKITFRRNGTNNKLFVSKREYLPFTWFFVYRDFFSNNYKTKAEALYHAKLFMKKH